MKFTFELPNDIHSLLPSIKNEITKHGGKLNGNEESGDFQGKGIEGSYVIQGRNAKIIITKKPLMINEKKIKEEIFRYFGLK